MFRNPTLRKLVFLTGLTFASMTGAYLRPDEIEDLLSLESRAKIECSVTADRDQPEDPLRP